MPGDRDNDSKEEGAGAAVMAIGALLWANPPLGLAALAVVGVAVGAGAAITHVIDKRNEQKQREKDAEAHRAELAERDRKAKEAAEERARKERADAEAIKAEKAAREAARKEVERLQEKSAEQATVINSLKTSKAEASSGPAATPPGSEAPSSVGRRYRGPGMFSSAPAKVPDKASTSVSAQSLKHST